MPALTRVDLRVPDLEGALRLFADVLGGRQIAAGGDALDLAFPGDGVIRLVAGPGPHATLEHLCMEVADLGHVHDRLLDDHIPVMALDGSLLIPADVASGASILVAAPGPRPPAPSATGTAGVRRFDHVCLATATIRETVALYRDVLGGDVVFGGVNPRVGTVSSQLRFGPGLKLELLQPHRPDAPIARFLERYGPGMHHLTFYVDDVTQADVAARDAGFSTTGIAADDRRRHWQETYLRPAATFGLLVQLAWTDASYDRALSNTEVAAIHDGRVDSYDYTMRPLTT